MRAIPRRRRVDELNMRKEFCYSPTVHLVFAFVYLTMTIVILFAGALFLYDTLVPGWFGEYEPRGVRRLVFAVIGIYLGRNSRGLRSTVQGVSHTEPRSISNHRSK